MPRPPLQKNVNNRRPVLVTFLALTCLLLLTAALSELFQPAARAATTFTVNSTGDEPDGSPGDGACNDGNGNCTLRAAIQQANATAGTDTINISVNGAIHLNGALPDLTTDMSINGPGSALLTVRRHTGGDYRIFFNNNRVVSISGLTITNGKTPDGAPLTNPTGPSFGHDGAAGGGILNAGTLTLTDVVVTGNGTGNGGVNSGGRGGWGGEGGGIFSGGTLTMTNVTISDNTTGSGATGNSGGTGGRGAGLFFGGVALTMTNVTVSNNRSGNGADGVSAGASGGGGGDGGGIYLNLGSLSSTNVTISGNATGNAGNGGSGGFGAGLCTYTGVQATLVDSVVINNSTGDGGGGTAGLGGLGGGIMNNGIMTATRVTVSGNATGIAGSTAGHRGGSGGGIYSSAALTLINSTVSGNSARGYIADGGGIYNSGNLLSLTNSTISNNQANPASDSSGGRGGGLYNSGNSTTLTNVTVTGNSSYTCCFFQSGQGVHNSGGVTARNSIIAGNGDGTRGDVTGNYTSQGHNIIGRAAGGGGSDAQSGFTNGVNGDQVGTLAAAIDPKLGALADNGGPTRTHALLSGSPALDAGHNSLAKDANNNALLTDQRGVGRFGGAGQTTDIGAFESHPTLENINAKTTTEDTTLPVSFNVGDGALNVTSVTAASDNQTLVPNAGLSVGGGGPVRVLQITPAVNQTGAANITVTVTLSGGATTNDSFALTVTPINDAPAFTKGADQTVAEDSGAQTLTNWATGISAGPDESGQSLSFVVSGNTNPGLFASAPAVSAAGTLTYTTATNANGSATITLAAKDDGGTAGGGVDTSAPQTFVINVTPVNDPPTAGDLTVSASEDIQRFISLAGSDADGNTLTFQIVSGPSNGTLSGTGSSRTYTPASNFNGADSFTYKATDTAGAESAAATVSINVAAVNDAPVNTVPFATQFINQNTPHVFSSANSNAISVADVDAGSDPVSVTLTAVRGTLTLGALSGLTFSTGDGTDDASMTFAGAISAVNTALGGLTFKPEAAYSGAASLQVTTNDQGSSGSGGARSDTDFVFITVRLGTIEFTQSAYTGGEGAGSLSVTVRRTGDTSQAASVAYATDDGSVSSVSVPCSSTTGIALDRCDFSRALGRLIFAPGETEKIISVLLSDDSYVEGSETALIRLSAPLGGPTLGSRTAATLEITDDAQETPSSNPIDDSGKFVRQHYHDFLGREPDAAGLAFWVNEIESCGSNAQCREVKRVNVSAAFFLSIEFQQTGYLVYRLDKVAFGNLTGKPVPLTLSEFLADTQSIGGGLVVGAEGWEQKLESNKRAFVDAFVTRSRFLSRYSVATPPEQYVDSLNVNAGGVLSQEERDGLVAGLRDGTKTRAQVLRAVAEHPSVVRRESNQAFVLMQFFGYLRRNPDSAPDSNFSGYSFWLSKLNEFNGNFIQAEMVKAFLESIEYRKRFGQ